MPLNVEIVCDLNGNRSGEYLHANYRLF
jgi:hypothetical protein